MSTLPKQRALKVPLAVVPVYSVTSHLKFVQDSFSEAPGIDSTVTHVPPSNVDVESFGVGLVLTLKQAVLTAAATTINDK